jgi:hypothetical protein
MEKFMFNVENWRGLFISKLVKDLNFNSYLELGVAYGNCCWNYVECEEKVGVDCTNDEVGKIEEVLTITTDEYFESIKETQKKFDIIYIDADHEKNQVRKDFFNSLKYLNKGGMIIVHDVYPISEMWTQKHLCGNSYEFWMSLSELYPEKTSIFMGYPGHHEGTVGIYYDKDQVFNKNSFPKMEYTYEYFVNNLQKYIYDKNLDYDQTVRYCKK